jgi:hypothetical protein
MYEVIVDGTTTTQKSYEPGFAPKAILQQAVGELGRRQPSVVQKCAPAFLSFLSTKLIVRLKPPRNLIARGFCFF